MKQNLPIVYLNNKKLIFIIINKLRCTLLENYTLNLRVSSFRCSYSSKHFRTEYFL